MIDTLYTIGLIILSTYIALFLLSPLIDRDISDSIGKATAKKIYLNMKKIGIFLMIIAIVSFFYSLVLGTILLIISIYTGLRAFIYEDRANMNYIYTCNIKYAQRNDKYINAIKKLKTKLKKTRQN